MNSDTEGTACLRLMNSELKMGRCQIFFPDQIALSLIGVVKVINLLFETICVVATCFARPISSPFALV